MYGYNVNPYYILFLQTTDYLINSAKFGIPNLLHFSDIGQNYDRSISDFRISGQSFINENCHNSRTSDDIDMKLGLVTKLDKRNTATSKKFDDEVMSANCDVNVFFPIYS